MQKENLIEKKEKILNLDLDTKKEIAKIGMTASLGVVTATSFYMKNNLMKNLHIGSGVALIGFSFWHHTLYQPNKKSKRKNIQKEITKTQKKDSAISIKKVYTELNVTGKLTSDDIKSFETKLESLVRESNVSSIDTLVDIRQMKEVTLLATWDDLILYLKNIKLINKIAVVGSKKSEKFLSLIANELTPSNMEYFDDYESAKVWIS